MTTFPNPPWNPNQQTADGRYVYVSPPGVWKLRIRSTASLTIADIMALVDDIATTPSEVRDIVAGELSSVSGSSIDETLPFIVSSAGDVVTLDLAQHRTLVVSSTTAPFSVTTVNHARARTMLVRLALQLSDAGHDPTLFFDVWEGTEPDLTALATGKVHLFSGEWIPVVAKWVGRYIGAFDPNEITPTPIVKPAVVIEELDDTPVNAGTISGSTDFRIDTDLSLVTRVDWFVDPVDAGNLPTEGSSSSAFVRSTTTAPFRMFGTDWDSTTDPSGSNRSSFNDDGAHIVAARLYWIDGTTTVETAAFTIDNGSATPNVPAAPTIASMTGGERSVTVDWDPVDGALGYDVFVSTTNPPPADAIPVTVTGTTGGELGTPTTNVDAVTNQVVVSMTPTATLQLNAGTDRFVIVGCVYRATTEITGMSVGGVNAIPFPNGSEHDASLVQGAWVGYIPAGSLPTDGSKTIAVTFASAPAATPEVHFYAWSVEGVKSPGSFVANTKYEFVDGSPLDILLAGVAANSMIFTAVRQNQLTGELSSADLAEDGSSTLTGTNFRSASEYTLNAGASGNKTINWTSSSVFPNRHVGFAVAIGYVPATSGAGSTGDAPTVLTVSNLADATEYFAQVAAFNSQGQRGARSTVANATTDVEPVTPTPGSPLARPLNHGFDQADVLLGAFGGAPVNNTTFSIPRPWYGRYAARWDLSWLGGWATSYALPAARDHWNTMLSRPKALKQVHRDQGPRAIFKLSCCPLWGTRADGSRFPYFNVIGTQRSVDTMLAMASVLGGDYDDDIRAYARAIRDFTGTGRSDWVDRVITVLGLEGNGNWADEYSGYDTYLIGNPTLANFSNATYGSTVGAIVRSVAVAGNRGLLTKAVYEHFVTVCRSEPGCQNMSFGTAYAAVWNTQTPGVPNPGSNDINFTSIPGPEYFDAYGFNAYFRGNGRFQYIGNGDPVTDVNTANWSSPTQAVLESVWNNICVPRQRSFLMPELGISMQSTKTGDTFSGANSDLTARIAAKWMLEDFLPSIDLALVNWWSLSDGDPANYPGESHDPLANQSTYPRYVQYLSQAFPP